MKMEFNKKDKSVIAVYAAVLAVYVLAFLIIPFDKNAASWISFVFTVIAIAASLVVCIYAFRTGETIVSKLYGFPIFRVGALYAGAQLVIGILICAISAFIAVPYWVALLLSVVLLGAAVIGVVITDNARDMVEEIDSIAKAEVETITWFTVDLAGVVDRCEDEAVKAQLEKLAEAFRFSDPVSNEKTKPAEEKIRALISELSDLVDADNAEAAAALVKKISNALAERNRICKASK